MSTSSPPPTTKRAGLWHNVQNFGALVKLSHTVFGLPFAVASALLAHRYAVVQGAPGLTWGRMGLVILAFTGARAAAMGFNRIVDRRFDAANPRTADREIPRGLISVPTATLLTGLCAVVFIVAAVTLGPVPALLSGPCLLLVFGYSLFKRFSWSSHLILGLALALAPGGAFIAITGGWTGWWIPIPLMVAVATWVAGFDILYSLADADFDRRHGLHSIPARFGLRGALWISGGLHLLTVGSLVVLHIIAGLGWAHLGGVGLIAIILAAEHWIVRPHDLSRLGKAFFDLNGYVSIAYLLAIALDLYVG